MNEKIFVTGASRGIGFHIAQTLQGKGFDVIGLARRKVEGHPFPVHAVDVGQPDVVADFFADFKKDPQVYGLVNAAGIASMNLLLTTPAATVERIIRTNLIGAINVSREFAKICVRNKRGRIIHFSTIAVPLALPGESIYIASKAGLEAFSRVFAREMALFGVTVNCVAPGPIDTDLIRNVPADNIEEVVQRQLIPKKMGSEEVSEVVVFLLSEQARMISGEVMHVGGV